ncbi:zinc transporter Zip99C isoform X1 [Andrena cerasifolii]|uniref:zinc transporter Zip99C isoform X1 n=1 Tax=Andrena cerasifolii TaxID=2819439 RepID=UPI00403844FB
MAANMCIQNCTDSAGFLYKLIMDDMWAPWEAAAEYFEYTPWLFSLLGSTMIGLTGIFPLLVIPIDEGADLKTGDSAGTLRILLSFAVGGLLGDVFMHLLPEAWGSYAVKTGTRRTLWLIEGRGPSRGDAFEGKQNCASRQILDGTDAGHPSMACGLWVLSGFLVFVIVEKLFSFEREPDTVADESAIEDKGENASVEEEKEMENNNCIPLTGNNLKNEFSKRYAKTDFSKTIDEPFLEKNDHSQMSNGYKDTRKNGFVVNGIKPMLMCNKFSNTLGGGLSLDDAKDCLKKLAKNGFSTELSKGSFEKKDQIASNVPGDVKPVMKQKPRHITGYLNLLANIIDNFTHGLAVGGSFLVSLRLGVLTTFAILIHEIPHEVGDFAILLRSGFNRWDAARAQLLTASGGIFGAMAAVLFSGGEVGAKTCWILPFTAGGFLHIGMVTILPELLKESSPKESLKQVAALLLGITVMAVLTILCD